MARQKRDKRKRGFKGIVRRNAAKQQRGNQFGYLNLPKGIQVFKEEAGGRVNLDILPYEVSSDHHLDRDDEYGIAIKGELWYKRPFYLHRNIGAENKAVVCPTSIGQRCPICEYRAQLMKEEGKDWNDKVVSALKPSLRNLYYVIPRDHKKFDAVPHIWDISQFCFQEALNEEIQENEDYETFPDLEEGKTLRIRFSEEKMGNNAYAKASRIDFKDRKPIKESILNELPSLDDLLDILSYKQLEALFYGGTEHDIIEEEEEEEEKPRKGKPSAPPEEEEDEEFVDDDEDEDEEEDSDDVDEDEEFVDVDEEEDEDVDEEEDEEEDEDEGEDGCPHGYTFGEDFENHEECEDCDSWDACYDAHDELAQSKKGKGKGKGKGKKK